MIKYKYKTGGWQRKDIIKKIKIEKETKAFVWVDGTQIAKNSDWVQIHNTFPEAKNFLLKKTRLEVAKLESNLKDAQSRFEGIQKLEPEVK